MFVLLLESCKCYHRGLAINMVWIRSISAYVNFSFSEVVWARLKSVHFKKTVAQSSFLSKKVVIFNITLADFILISKKMTTLLQEMRIQEWLINGSPGWMQVNNYLINCNSDLYYFIWWIYRGQVQVLPLMLYVLPSVKEMICISWVCLK